MRPDRFFHRFALGALVTSSLAGCNQVADLSEFKNAHAGSSDASASGTDATSPTDAEPIEAAHEDGQETPLAEAGLDAFSEDATAP